jgi:hypothetical protein
MDGSTEGDILTSIILNDLQDGLASGFISFDSEQYSIKPRTERIFTPNIGRISGSFYLRGTNDAPISGTLNIYPSMSVDPETIEPYYYMFYVTDSFDRRISIEVTDYENNIISSGIPGKSGIPFYSAIETKQLTTKFTYLEDITSASISMDKTFFSVPDGNPGDDAIFVKINPNPITLNSDQRGRVFSYETANTDITVTQGFLPLIFTSSKKPGTFTTASIITNGIEYSIFDEIMGDTSMSISGFNSMTDLTASVEYRLEIHPFYTASYYTESFVQQFQKSVDGAAAINIELLPTIIALSADENGGVFDYTTANATLKVKQGDEYLEYNSAELPGTFTASISLTNISVGLLTSSKTETTDNGLNDTMNFVSMSNMTEDSASIDYSILVRPFSITNGIVTGSQYVTHTQSFTKQKSGVNARSVSLAASSLVVNFDGDGVVTSPLGSIFLSATPFNVTASQAYYQYFQDGFPYSTIGTNTTFEIGSGDATSPGQNATWQVQMRDGNINSEVIATAEVTIAGIKAGADNYQVSLTNDNTSVLIEVDGTSTLDGTGTQIRVLKGTTQLTNVNTYSAQALDLTGEPIGSLGEYSASLHSKPIYITQTNIPIGNPAAIGPIQFWDTPQTNTNATIVYKVDIENGRATYFVSQSLSAVFEGATGPGVVFRGPWTGSIEYIYNKDTKRRDAVLYSVNGGEPYDTYYATADSGSSYLVPFNTPPTVGGVLNEDYWVSLGQEDFFVAAKLAIFEESFVKNTINVGSPSTAYDVNPQIAIVGGTNEPYISIGQETQGYRQSGVYIGVTQDGGPLQNDGIGGLLSLIGTSGSLTWDGAELNVSGIISASEGRFGGWIIDPSGIYFPTTFPVGYQYTIDTTAAIHGDYFAELENLLVGGSYWANRGRNPFDGSGSALLTVFGLVTTTHRILAANNSDPKNALVTLSSGLYANSSSLQIDFHTTGSVQKNDKKMEWQSGTDYLQLYDTDGTTTQSLSNWLAGTTDYENPSVQKSTIIKPYDVVVLGIGNVLDFPAMKIYGFVNGDETKLQLSGSNPYPNTIQFSGSADVQYYYPTLNGDYTFIQASISAGSRTARIIDGEGLRLSTSGSTLNDTSKPYLSMGQLSQSFDEVGVFLGFPSGSDDPLFSLRSKDGAYLNYTGNGVNFSGTIQGSTINGSSINGGELNIGLKSGSLTEYNFMVDTNGNVNATNAVMSGIINATSGRIGNWVIDDSGNLRDDDSRIILDPTANELQFFANDAKKVIISPSVDLTSTGGAIGSFSFPNTTLSTIEGVQTNANNTSYVYSNYATSSQTTETFPATIGSVEVTLDIPQISISIPAAVTHTTSYPSYLPSFTGQRHSGYSSPSVASVDLNLEAVLVSTGAVVGRTILATAYAYSGTNSGNYYLGTYTGTAGGGGSTSCLIGSSLIEMSDGSFKQIKDIQIGDFIKSLYIDSLTPKYSEENDWKSDNISNSQKITEEVLNNQLYSNKEIYNINNGLIECTSSHKHIIKQNGVWCINTTDKLNIGDIFLNSENVEIELTSITINEKTEDVYNIRVSGKHTYYVNGILTHNNKLIDEPAPQSVSGDTKITLSSGETILAENIVEGQKILAWSWNDKLDDSTINQFDEFEIQKVEKRKVDKIYKVRAGGKTIKVSDSHGFWLNDNEQIKTTELVVGESMINIKDGNGIKLVLVDTVEIIETDEYVYTFGVPGVHNYISDDIISHNDGYWDYVPNDISSGFSNTGGGISNTLRLINFTEAGDVKFRYSLRFYGYSGARQNLGSDINSYTDAYQRHTIGPNLANTPVYDSNLSISIPSNFVEIKAGGIQIVSDPNTFVRIPRRATGDTNPEIFTAEGGTSHFNAGTFDTSAIITKGDITPETTGLYDIGTATNQFANLNGVSLNSFDKRIVKAVARITGRSSTGGVAVNAPSYNISSVTRGTAGVYTITLSDTIANGDGAPFVSGYGLFQNNTATNGDPASTEFTRNIGVKVSGNQFIAGFKDNDTGGAQDPSEFYFIVYGAE